jgi:hypothetical protein
LKNKEMEKRIHDTFYLMTTWMDNIN